MSSNSPRVLYIPNEHAEGQQRGPRLALAQLKDAGHIRDVRAFSHLWRLRSSSTSATLRALKETIESFKPSLVLLQHPAGTGLRTQDWQSLRRSQDFKLIYHEGDAYDLLRKRVPAEMRAAASAADVSFSVGGSKQLRHLRSAGSPDARWTPSVFNANDFGSRPLPANRDYDVVMIANESSSRIPLRSIPGSRQRAELVQRLARRFGRKFIIYGRGWTGPSAAGPLPYLDQEMAIQSAWVSANWDHYPQERNFFSDRLPIALASGTIHVTTSHPGYDDLFGRQLSFLHHEQSVDKIIKRIELLLDRGAPFTQRNFQLGREYSHAKFRQDDNLVTLLNAGGAGISLGSGESAWNLHASAISDM